MAMLPAQLPFILGRPTGYPYLTLPEGALPTGVPFDPENINQGRVTGYRFDLLDTHENLLGHLLSVPAGGYLEWHAYASIKGGGSLTVVDLGDAIDWLNVRIRPNAIISDLSDSAGREVPLGVFIPSAPVETWTDTGRAWAVELLDKCSVLDQDIPTEPMGNPYAYTAAVGANIIELVVALITSSAENTPAIEPSDRVLTNPLVWDLGTSKLKIINDLLGVGNFFSLWCDGQGQFRTSPYVDPSDRAPVYAASTPFSKGDFSLMTPDWERDRDIYSIPNRYVAISQGSADEEAMVAVVTNEDPLSPFSYQNRGSRWYTRTVTNIEATSEADLQSYARRGLAQATSVTSGIKANHLFLPDLLVNSVVQFLNPDADLDIRCIVTSTTVPFDPIGLCTSELREVVGS